MDFCTASSLQREQYNPERRTHLSLLRVIRTASCGKWQSGSVLFVNATQTCWPTATGCKSLSQIKLFWCHFYFSLKHHQLSQTQACQGFCCQDSACQKGQHPVPSSWVPKGLSWSWLTGTVLGLHQLCSPAKQNKVRSREENQRKFFNFVRTELCSYWYTWQQLIRLIVLLYKIKVEKHFYMTLSFHFGSLCFKLLP